MKKLAILFATFVCFAMISGSFAATNQNTEKIIQKPYYLLNITVSNNPSTGYSWNAVYDKNKVNLIKKYYYPPLISRPGLGGMDVYVFFGQIGQKITLNHIAPNGKVVETKIYTIN